MAIPNHEQIQYEALKLLTDNVPRRRADLVGPLAKVFNLTEEEINKKYDSGNGFIFENRIGWALSYLNMSGVATKPKRGLYVITELGHELSKDPIKFREHVDQKYKEWEVPEKVVKDPLDITTLTEEERTPEESLYNSYEEIRNSVYQEILETILSKTPREFEKLVVTLLQKMGYGGEITDSGVVTSYSKDKGIDGIIKEDILGFGTICKYFGTQAKKFLEFKSHWLLK